MTFIKHIKAYTPKWRLLGLSLISSVFLVACQEDEVFEELESTTALSNTETASRKELSLDSLYLYARQTYLWYDALPEYQDFNPRNYASHNSELKDLSKAVFDLSQYARNPETGQPYEFVSPSGNRAKYSYIKETESAFESQSFQSVAPLDGQEDDFGFALSSVAADDIRIRYVNAGSPAANAGLSRGDMLLKINGRSVRADSKSDISLINNSLNQSGFTITVKKADGAILEKKLSKASYTLNPVYKNRILEAGTNKVGYVAYSRFSSKENSFDALDEAFAEFASAGVTDLVVDLRYNGGGYVSTAEYLCNLIAPSSLNGSVMYKEVFNDIMQEGRADILKHQVLLDQNDEPVKYRGRNATYADMDYSEAGKTFEFNKKGTLGSVKNVYFIISGKTASASELVINALKPYLNVTIIGSPSYGKPVGFFGIRIDDYTLYMSNFTTVNSAGEGNYFSGFEPDILASDDVTHDFGDPREACMSMAMSMIEEGSKAPGNARITLRNGKVVNANELDTKHLGDEGGFNGMIEDRNELRH